MKNICMLFSIILFSKCITESKMYQRAYSIKNESNQNISLRFYLKFNHQLVYNSQINLNNTAVFNGDILEFSQPLPNDGNYLMNSAFKASDSLVITYNNTKKSTFTVDFNGNFSTPLNRNPFRHGNYQSNGEDNFQFTITQNDYNTAEDCNGNCD